MVLTANAYTRLTLALDIAGRIPDGPYAGYHELGVIKHRIDLCDTVTVEDAAADAIECDDPLVPCDGANICLKAADILRRRCGIDRRVRITLLKRIPVMGGLAGGSADAATVFGLLNRLWGLNLAAPELIALSRGAGMDVPYYFMGGTAFDSEAGLRLEPVQSRCDFVFVLACPEFGVSTREAYGGIDYAAVGRAQEVTSRLRAALEQGDAPVAVQCMHNDFELSVFARFPRCAVIKKELLDAGCLAALLSGSGSTMIGIARNAPHAEEARRKVSCKTIIAATYRPSQGMAVEL